MAHSKEKIKSTEAAPEKDRRATLPGKDFKRTVLQMLKGLKEDVEKDFLNDIYKWNVKNRNINKEIENPKRKPKRSAGTNVTIKNNNNN